MIGEEISYLFALLRCQVFRTNLFRCAIYLSLFFLLNERGTVDCVLYAVCVVCVNACENLHERSRHTDKTRQKMLCRLKKLHNNTPVWCHGKIFRLPILLCLPFVVYKIRKNVLIKMEKKVKTFTEIFSTCWPKKQNVKVSHLTPKPCVSWTTVNEFSPAKTDISERDKCVNDAFLVSEMITLSGSLVELKCEKTYKKFTDSRPKSAMKKLTNFIFIQSTHWIL